MKNILCILIAVTFSVIANHSSAQNAGALEKEFSKLNEDTSVAVSQQAFLSSDFCKPYGLDVVNTKNYRMHVWNSSSKENILYNAVYDIRWNFATNKEASAFASKYEPIISENSTKIKGPKKKIEGADAVTLYEDFNSEKMMKDFGLPASHNYCYIIVVDTYVIKLYFSASDKVSPEDVTAFAEEAVRRTHAVLGK